ncbi:MAG: prepilin peptidase [Candidatus Thorarchaeota archaeon]
MVLDLSLAAYSSFLTVTSLLVVYSVLDIRQRRVPNEYMMIGFLVGSIVILLTGHLLANLVLHATALVIVFAMGYTLFRMRSIGGADVKNLLLVALISPGIELRVVNVPIIEAVVGMGVEFFVMLLGGYLYWRTNIHDEKTTPPLIPFLLLGYLTVQLLALPLAFL